MDNGFKTLRLRDLRIVATLGVGGKGTYVYIEIIVGLYVSRFSNRFKKVQTKQCFSSFTGFGRVELVQIASSSPLSAESSGRPKSYALKMMKKSHIVETRQQQVMHKI